MRAGDDRSQHAGHAGSGPDKREAAFVGRSPDTEVSSANGFGRLPPALVLARHCGLICLSSASQAARLQVEGSGRGYAQPRLYDRERLVDRNSEMSKHETVKAGDRAIDAFNQSYAAVTPLRHQTSNFDACKRRVQDEVEVPASSSASQRAQANSSVPMNGSVERIVDKSDRLKSAQQSRESVKSIGIRRDRSEPPERESRAGAHGGVAPLFGVGMVLEPEDPGKAGLCYVSELKKGGPLDASGLVRTMDRLFSVDGFCCIGVNRNEIRDRVLGR